MLCFCAGLRPHLFVYVCSMTTQQLVLLWVLCGGIGAAIGATKGSKSAPIAGLVAGSFLGPLGWLLIALSPKQGILCGACRGAVPAGAAKCLHCASDLTDVGVVKGEANASTASGRNVAAVAITALFLVGVWLAIR